MNVKVRVAGARSRAPTKIAGDGTVVPPMTAWTFADAYERIAEAIPDAPCQEQGDRIVTWSQFDHRADALARDLLAAGLGEQAKVAVYLTNCPEYLEAYLAAFKAGLVPVNTNFRYGPEEIFYLFDNADAEAVVFHAAYTDVLEAIRARLPSVRRWYVVDDGHPAPAWATSYAEVADRRVERALAPWGRSPDHVLLLYTGGTTGMPKGVMWRQDDLFNVLGGGGSPILGQPPAVDLDDLASRITGPGARFLPACPLMHGTGALTTMTGLISAGSVVTMEGRRFDPVELLDAVQSERVNVLAIVGDAFAKPMLAALEAEPERWDVSSLVVMVSSGVMWSEQSKQGLLRHHPGMILADSFGSSEAVGMGTSVSSASGTSKTAKFALGENTRVITEDGRDVVPGSEEIGMVAVRGRVPIGYYKDPAKSASTFREFDGVRYSIPGDYATVEADGTLRLLGRGSVCINTGGEKVYPEEVEETVKEHPAVADAVVVGVPDERFGEAICALVELRPGHQADEADIVSHVRARLAAYKAPRRVLPIESIGRAPNGKVDYRSLREQALTRLGL